MHSPLNEAQQSIAKDNRAVVKLKAIKRILHRRQRQMHERKDTQHFYCTSAQTEFQTIKRHV